jgi:amino acid adenylation domain-containing protein
MAMSAGRIEARIEAWAAVQPDRVVARSDSGALTFGRLDRLANKLAHRLRAVGVGPGDYVLVCCEREPVVLVAILAVLKAGAAFIPVDPGEPGPRIARIAGLAEVSCVVAAAPFAAAFEGLGLYSLLLDLDSLERAAVAAERPRPVGEPDDPAYGIPTSGSSGTPKTVAVAHRPVINLIEWIGETFRIGPDDQGLWISPASFDLSVFDLLGLPALGAGLRMVSRDQRRDPGACADILRRDPITFWNSTPALLQTLLPFLGEGGGAAGREHLRLAFLSGDWVPLSLPDRLRVAFPQVEVVALGGATEAAIWSNFHCVGEVDPSWASIPYGRPIRGARYHVLDPRQNPCATGDRGELYIGGDCLALGYLGDPGLTATRFLPDPHGGHRDARMYRTGDAARQWPDGTLELLGRLDDQVNVSGYRVDLGEVEVALKRCGLSQAVVAAVDGATGTQRLVAAGVPREGARDAEGLRAQLRGWLPSHMVPDTLRLVDALPLTANGKADRKAVARWFASAPPPPPPATARPVAPNATPAEIEAFLDAEIRALGGGSAGSPAADRPLGEAGLGSLEFALLSGRLFEAFGLRVSPVEFYAGGTLAAVAAAIARMPAAPAAPGPAAGSHRREPDDVRAAVVGMSCRLPLAADLDELWRNLLAGRDCLRTMPAARAGLQGGEGAGVRGGFLDGIDAFDAGFFGITPREAAVMDPRQRLLLEAVWTAVEHAGEDPSALSGSRTGVFVGATGDDFSRLAHRDPETIGAHTLTGISPSLLANRISFTLDLRGPSETVDTACSSSLVALHRALSALSAGDCDAAIVGGVSLMLDPATTASLARLGMLSADGACKTFDARADGYARGEGVAVVYLKPAAAARAAGNQIYALVLGSALNHNGRTVSLTSPTPEAQKRVIRDAWRQAGIDPSTVGMIEAHGTGTALGDPIETRALVDAFAELYEDHGLRHEGAPHCALNAVKANLGHLESAAGIVGLVKAILAARGGIVPPIPHFERLNERIDLRGSPFFVSAAGGPWPVAAARRAGVSSFGFGGANAHVAIEAPPEERPPAPAAKAAVTIAISAREPAALRSYARAYADFFQGLITDGAGDEVLADIGFTSRRGRPVFAHRFACVAETLADARDRFCAFADGAAPAGEAIDWEAIRTVEAGRPGRRVAIPTYPFLRARHWPSWLSRTAAEGAPEIQGERELALAPLAFLVAAHRIGGAAVIPGAVFVRLLLELSRSLPGGPAARLERIRFLGNVESSALPATLSASWDCRDGVRRLAIRGAVDGPLFCRAVAGTAPGEGGRIELPRPSQPAVDREGVYARLRDHGIELGPELRTIRRAYQAGDRCVAALSGDGSAPDFDPALLDGALQAALWWQLATDPPAGLPVPISIDALTVYRALPGSCTVVVSTAPGSAGNGSPRITDLVIADDEGRVCLRLEGFAAVAHRRAAAPVTLFAKSSIEIQPPAGPGALLHGPALTIDPDEPLAGDPAAAMERLLDRFEREQGRAAATVVLRVGEGDWSRDLERLAGLGKALARRPSRGPVRLLAVGRIAAEEDSPLGAALGAFARSLRLEHPDLVASAVGLRSRPGEEAEVAGTVPRLTRGGPLPPELEIDCATGRCFAPAVQPVESAAPPPRARFRQEGVYLLTGGLGGVGRLVARELAGRFAARLMLCGRSPAGAGVEARLAALRACGGEVAYQPADVTRRPEVRRLVAETRARFGRIDGILHGAGLLRDGLLAYAEPGDLVEAARPKLLGARYLDLETRDEELDFFLLFSSLVATLGNAGQCGYAFANGWLEGFAAAREARRLAGACRGRTVAVGWGPWNGDGMSLPPPLAERLEARHGVAALAASAGVAALDRILAAAEPTLLAIAGNPVRVTEWVRRRSFSPASGPVDARHVKMEVRTMDRQALETRAMALIVDAIAQESQLPPDRIVPAARFEEYGIDSVLIMALTERLEDSLGALPKTLFFEHRTAAELAGHLADAYAAPLAALLGETGATAAVRTLAGAESQAAPRLDRREEAIAIIGMDGRFPEADDLEEFWRNLEAGRDCISEVPPDRWDHRLVVPPDDPAVGPESGFRWGGFLRDAFTFDPQFFRMSRREAEMIDPQERLFLLSAYHCLEDAGYPGAALAGTDVGVFVGVMWGQYEMWGLERGDAASSYGSIAHRVSYSFDFRGPSLAVDSMCSSSLTAIHLACASLRSGESQVAIAGGVNVNAHPNKHLFLCRRRFAAADGRCRSFGAGGGGYVAGEGVGTVLLKPLSAAERDGDRILGLVRATAINHDGRTNGYTVPNPRAQADVVRAALARAGIEPRTITCVEAHGTGTPLGDPIEVSALTAAFQPWPAADGHCALGSVKSNIGHAESAAGIAGVIKVLLQMRHQRLVPSIHADPPNPDIRFEDTPFRVQREPAPWPAPPAGPRRAGVSSFGAGGANAHVILEERIPAIASADGGRDEAQLVTLSARTEERLLEYVRRLLAVLEASEGEAGPAAALPAAEGRTLDVLLDLVAETLGLDRRFVRDDDRFDEYGLTPSAAGGLAARIAGAFGVPVEEVRPLDHEGPAGLARWLDGARGGPGGARRALRLADIAYTLQTGREPMAVRLALNARSTEELTALLRHVLDRGGDDARICRGVAAPVARAASEAERTFLSNLVAGRRLDKLARLWCEGADVDGSGLHPRGTRRRLDLPGYPFAREICRVAEPTPLIHGRAGALHPLIDAVDLGQSLDAGITLRKTLSRHAPLAPDCRVDGRPALGGALALAAAAAAGRLATRSDAIILASLRWREPYPLGSDLEDLLIRLAPAGEGQHTLTAGLEGDPAGPFLTTTLRATPAEAADGAPDTPDADHVFDLTDAVGESAQWAPELLDRALRFAAAAQGAPPAAAATAERLRVQGTVPERGRIVVAGARAIVLAEDGAAWLEISGLRFDEPEVPDLARPREIAWVEAAIAATAAAADDRVRVVLSSPAERPLRDALMRQLPAGSTREIELDGTRSAEELAAAVRGFPEAAELFLLTGGGRPLLEPDATAIARAVAPLLGLARGLDALAADGRCPALRVLTLSAYRVGDEAVNPVATAAAALVPTLARETRRAEVSGVDLVASRNEERLEAAVRQALAVLRDPLAAGRVLALREGRVFRRTLRPLTAPQAGPASALQRGESCLIVGGSGVVGRQLSAELARRFGARLVWIGRRRMDDSIAAAARRIEALGGSLGYVSADVADPGELREVLEETWRQHGPVGTVFHCGMDFSVSRLAATGEAAFGDLTRAKTIGSLALLKALQDYPVRQVVMMSSAETLAGNAGWGPYCYGCAFQDGLAQAVGGGAAGRVLSVDWGYWEGSERGDPSTLAAKGVRPLSARTALAALEAILATGLRQAAVLDVEPQVLERMGLPEAASAVPPPAVLREPDVAALPPPVAGPSHRTTETRLRQLLGQTLRIKPDEIDPAADMAQYGVDSILILDFVALVEQTFGRMRVEELIEHQTLGALASEVDRQLAKEPRAPEAAAAVAAVPPPAPPGTLVDAAPAEEVGAALREYPQRLDLGDAELRLRMEAVNGHPALQFWMIGRTAETAVEVVSCGTGAPVLFLPGIGLTAPVFHQQFEALWPDWSVLTLHAPGQGRSKPPKQATIAALADTIVETLWRFDLRRPVHIVGSCFGTVVAQYLASHRPDLVASLTLCGTLAEDADMSLLPADGLSAEALAALTEGAAQSLAADFDPLLAAPANAGRREAIEEARRLLLASQRASAAIGMRYLNEVLKLRPSEWAPAITAPTFFVAGTLDTVVDPEASLRSAALIPKARILRIADAGHYPFLTHASEFNPALLEFLGSVEHAAG